MSLPFPQPTAIPRAAQGSLYGAAPRTAAGMPARPAASAYANQAARYRDAELASASPGQLVVMLFDKILLTLRRARLACEARKIEDRVELLLKANEMITELRISLDFEQGGAISQNLDALYAFSLRQLFEASRTGDVTKIDGVLRVMSELRDAFAQVVAGSAAGPGAAPAAPALPSAVRSA
ncbi:MAG: flagellar export chaperone FliS [Gemmatirosa sp.]